jgi:hypothetical protein
MSRLAPRNQGLSKPPWQLGYAFSGDSIGYPIKDLGKAQIKKLVNTIGEMSGVLDVSEDGSILLVSFESTAPKHLVTAMVESSLTMFRAEAEERTRKVGHRAS